MTDKVREQILKVRDTGKTNMFDTCMVQRIGLKMGFYEMVIFIEENKGMRSPGGKPRRPGLKRTTPS